MHVEIYIRNEYVSTSLHIYMYMYIEVVRAHEKERQLYHNKKPSLLCCVYIAIIRIIGQQIHSHVMCACEQSQFNY